MRVVIQRILSGSVTVDNTVVSSIGNGLLCLIGIGENDTLNEAKWAIDKILKLRLFSTDPDENGQIKRWRRNIKQKDYEILMISQFTLYCKIKKNGNPDFHSAMGGEQAQEIYNWMHTYCAEKYNPDKVKDGIFGAMMDVSLINDGPVTITLNSEDELTPQPLPQPPIKNNENTVETSNNSNNNDNNSNEEEKKVEN